MKSLVVPALLLLASCSLAPTPVTEIPQHIAGRFALVMEQPIGKRLEADKRRFSGDAATLAAMIDKMADVEILDEIPGEGQASEFDGVIVFKRDGARLFTAPATNGPDIRADQFANVGYEVLRGGTRVASGAVTFERVNGPGGGLMSWFEAPGFADLVAHLQRIATKPDNSSLSI